jgi:hypothetical protein
MPPARSPLTTVSSAFVLSGLLALVLAMLSAEARLTMGALAAVSAAVGLGLHELGRRQEVGPPPPEPPDEPEPWAE